MQRGVFMHTTFCVNNTFMLSLQFESFPLLPSVIPLRSGTLILESES